MRLLVEKNYEDLSTRVAGILAEEIRKNPNIVLGLATGGTPIGTYEELIRIHKAHGLDFSGIRTFNLDEYIGLDGSHPNSYRYFMNENLFNYINIDKENTYIPNGEAKNPEEYAKEYDKIIDSVGGIDIQILGIGTNGHIAFNEPSKELSVGTSVIDLAESTIEDNSRFFDSIDQVPKAAITMGIGSILKAREIILLANGENKAKIIKELLETDMVTTELPASFLLLHPNLTVIVDEAAYSEFEIS